MKSWVSGGRFAACIFALALFGQCSATFAAAGRTVGTYQVSPSGAATYTIPIRAPRGPNGLQPHISLVYNSQRGNGYMGVGWSVAGISSIYRCNLTYAHDQTAGPVALTTSDGLCLDGQRLSPITDVPDEAGATYRTEVSNLDTVTAYGAAGNGPAYFLVYGSDGTEYEYGNTSTSQVLADGSVLQWCLDRVTDTSGNTMTISYNIATESAVPSTISWTSTGSGYNYTMTFLYGTNATESSFYGYVAGTAVVNTNLLTSITVAYAGSAIKYYALTYTPSPTTGREELTQVKECTNSAESSCLAPTAIAYQNGTVGTETTATAAVSGVATNLVSNYDFNGDGLNDLAYCNTAIPSTIDVALSTGNGYATPINTGIACGALFGDLLGNGQDGILTNKGGTWYYYSLEGGVFSGVSTGLAYDSTATQYILADVNGDGLPDLVESKVAIGGGGLTIYVLLNSGGGSGVSFSSSTVWFTDSDSNLTAAQLVSNTSGQFGNLRRLDFNGDGRDDLALQVEDTIYPHGGQVNTFTAYELISASRQFQQFELAHTAGSTFIPVGFGNFNSDACTDYVLPGGATNDSVIYISGCNGSLPQQFDFGPVKMIGAMDWYGDGLTDILVPNGSTIGVYEWTGNGLSSLQSTSVPYSASNVYFGLSGEGDALDDIGVWSTTSPYSVSYFQHNGVGEPPDLMSSVTDGYGNYAKPTYVSIARAAGSVYTPVGPISAQYPYENYRGPLYVVSNTLFSDASNPPNGTYTERVAYTDAWMNLQGRGSAGFQITATEDSRNGITDYRNYDQTFPYTGMLSSRTLQTDSGESFETISNSLSTVSFGLVPGTYSYIPYVSGRTVKRYEVGGDESGDLTSTETSTYSINDYGNIVQAISTITDNDPGSPYVGDSWTTTVNNTPDDDGSSINCYSLLTESQISYTASDGSPSVTRTRDYTPDLTHCRYTQVVTEPASGSYEVTEVLGYDNFGNVDSDSVTGSGMTARVVSASWGATGQFPMTLTDPSGAQTQFNYDFGYGLVSSETDPNGLTTSWQYADGFGRVTKETRPDGTSTTYAYGLNSTGPLAARLVVTEQPRDTGGNVITTTELYSDMLDRPMGRIDTLLNGAQAWTTRRFYDSLGRIASTCPPYLVGASSPGCTTYTYDILNRATQMQRPINQSDSTLQTTAYAYAGRTTTITDPNSNIRTQITNVTGWLRQAKDALGYAVILGYDAAGSKTSVTDSLRNSLWTGTYAYGIAPFLVGESDMDRGTWGYTVDALGERTAWTDAKEQHFSESYDALSRPLTRTEPDLFTQWTWGSKAASHNIGKLASVCSGTGTACSSSYYSESESYDSVGRLYQRAVAIPVKGAYTPMSLTIRSIGRTRRVMTPP